MAAEIQIQSLDHFAQRLEPSDAGSHGFGVFVNDWDGTSSIQAVWGDFEPAAGYGTSTTTAPVYGAGGMFNITGSAAVTGTDNILAGLIGKWSLTGTISSTYAGAAVRGEIGGSSTSARAAILAVMSGEEGTSTATAAYGVDWNTGNGLSAFTYGIDLEGPDAHDSYRDPRYSDAFLRLGGRILNKGYSGASGELQTINDLCLLAGTKAPVDGTTGSGFNVAGPGSLYVQQNGSSSKLYINTNTKASPTWTVVGSQS